MIADPTIAHVTIHSARVIAMPANRRMPSTAARRVVPRRSRRALRNPSLIAVRIRVGVAECGPYVFLQVERQHGLSGTPFVLSPQQRL